MWGTKVTNMNETVELANADLSPHALLCLSLPGVERRGAADARPVPSTAPPAFREMQQVEDHWSDAVTKRDQYGLELVLAPQFIGISASGDVTTRNQQIAHSSSKARGPIPWSRR